MADEVTILRIPTRVAFLREVTGKGWWIRFEGSQERMFAGAERPNVEVGDTVFIDIIKAKP
jgi:hypothetical protein